jgi:hypothetical protein
MLFQVTCDKVEKRPVKVHIDPPDLSLKVWLSMKVGLESENEIAFFAFLITFLGSCVKKWVYLWRNRDLHILTNPMATWPSATITAVSACSMRRLNRRWRTL